MECFIMSDTVDVQEVHITITFMGRKLFSSCRGLLVQQFKLVLQVLEVLKHTHI